MINHKQILEKDFLKKEDIVTLLSLNKEDARDLFAKSEQVKLKFVGNKVYYRGLIEMSNICRKDCYYCGIRRSNKNVSRYELDDKQIFEAAEYAYINNFASIVIQGGERSDKLFTDRITFLLEEIMKRTNNSLGITLSFGEQTAGVFKKWKNAGARRYLLRIEEYNRDLYKKLHPDNDVHSFDERFKALYLLKQEGYQVGTGVMIGLPFQTIEHLADNLLFFRDFDIDMVGMGPYIEHEDTPLYKFKDQLWSLEERLFMSFKMLAVLRIMVKDINIAATTALQTIDPIGREKAVKIAANVIMPNITPGIVRKNYLLYENKPCTDEEAEDCLGCLKTRLKLVNAEIGFDEWGDSKHFFERTKD
ncbi:MAG TPA: [FeFe] hydrogenase H-cluster radical SAM maturase HydE [Bacteroidetes bacterium]|nr:[FeFe] hydrogenase H-cluster radical SAM maturase HydE [Bacteroidota bacterium]